LTYPVNKAPLFFTGRPPGIGIEATDWVVQPYKSDFISLLKFCSAVMFLAKVEELQKAQGSDSGGSAVTGQGSDARMTLILDLSSKVTEQEHEIIRLRDQLRKHNLTSNADRTLTTTHSEVSESLDLPKLSATDCHHMPVHWNSYADSVDNRGPSSNCNEHNGITPTDVKSNFSLARTSREPVESYFKNSTKGEKNGAHFRAHWASSCFDMDELTNDDDVEKCKTDVCDDDTTVSGSTLR